MGQPTAQGTRCPSCSAAVRAGAPWCTQCYVRLDDDSEQAPAVRTSVPPAAPEPTAERPPAAVSAGVGWPCSACGQRNDLADETCTGCGTPFLAAVRDDRPSLVLPVLGDVTVLPPARRLAAAVAVLVALLAVIALLALLLA